MDIDLIAFAVYGAPIALILLLYLRKHRRRERVSMETFEESREANLLEPASLHPVINLNQCIGCGSCVAACPEMPAHQVLGMLKRKAHLVSPTDCIGHGACKSACPVDAITLVFGTERRGVDIPNVNSNFETDVPGIFIAGELGGMGLIRNAIEQGRQAMECIARKTGGAKDGAHDVIIVGAGPAGISASLAAKQHKLKFVTVEQDSLGGTVASFPRRKLVMTSPAMLPIVGKMKFTETTKEKLLAYWQDVVDRTQLKIHFEERLESVNRQGDLFEVVTTRTRYSARAVLLALGRRGTPRKLGVPGEEQTKVTYRLIDPEQYRDMQVLVVGGGDSALECAAMLSEQPGTTITLSYRSKTFSRAKRKNRLKLEDAEHAGRIQVLLESEVRAIGEQHVEIEHKGKLLRIANEAVIINAGGILPIGFLKELGIGIDTKYGAT